MSFSGISEIYALQDLERTPKDIMKEIIHAAIDIIVLSGELFLHDDFIRDILDLRLNAHNSEEV